MKTELFNFLLMIKHLIVNLIEIDLLIDKSLKSFLKVKQFYFLN